MSARASAVLGVALALVLSSGTGLASDVPTFEITTAMGKGNGFVVRDWRGTGGYLLVTALHVVHNQTDITAQKVDCSEELDPAPWRIPHGTQVLVWPHHDLAAFVISDSPFLHQSEAGTISFGPPPPTYSLVHVEGTSANNTCQEGMGYLMGNPLSGRIFDNLQMLQAQKERGVDARRMKQLRKLAQGSMAEDIHLLQYFSPSAPGSSGAAVTRPESPKTVVGIHNGGYNNKEISWAISFSGLQQVLATPQSIVRLGQTAWPSEYERSFAGQSASFDSLPDELSAQARRTLNTFLVEAGCLGETGISGALKRNAAWTCRGAFSFEFLRLPVETRRTSLAVRLGVGHRWAQVQQVLIGPDGQVLREQLAMGKGLMIEPEVEVRFRRNARFQPALGVRGRFWLARYPVIAGDAGSAIVNSYAAATRFYFAPFDAYPVSNGVGFAELGLAWGHEVRPGARYTGVGAEMKRYNLDRSVSTFLTVGLAYGQ